MSVPIAQRLQQDSSGLRAALTLEAGEARLEVQMLLQQVLRVPRSYLLAHSERILDAEEETHYQSLLQRRMAGEPMAHILGEREFFGLPFKVTPATLIPRPDTELLVELALERIPVGAACQVLDLGTGTGAIALSIAHHRPAAGVTAVDASAAAVQVAGENARRLQLDNVSLLQSDWFSELNGQQFDLIVSNPPYVASGDIHLSQGDVRFEPVSALASGLDGLDDIRRIIAAAPQHLKPHAWLLLEHGYDQAAAVRELLQQAGFGQVFSARDLGGNERVTGGRAE